MEKAIFVYGTLKVGGNFAKYFDKYRISSTPFILNDYAIYDLGPFPAMSLSAGDRVVGEAHKYSDFKSVMDSMDRVESYNKNDRENSLFLRKSITKNIDNVQTKLYFYIINRNYITDKIFDYKINSGIWKI